MSALHGIHHVTAICSDAQVNLDFYTGVLGMRLIKISVNQDDPGTYHLFYGDAEATPGTDLTFFPYPGGRQAKQGAGMVVSVALAVPVGSLEFWMDRFAAEVVEFDMPVQRFGRRHLGFRDPDGMALELVEDDEAGTPWTAVIGSDHAIVRIVGVTIAAAEASVTEAALASSVGHAFEAEEKGVRRHRSVDGRTWVDVVKADSWGQGGHGGVHHVAFGIDDASTQDQKREELVGDGFGVSPIMDRMWFRSIYFREPGGVLFELATMGPGMTFDESLDSLGTGVKLPPWLEPEREKIERLLPPLRPPTYADPSLTKDVEIGAI